MAELILDATDTVVSESTGQVFKRLVVVDPDKPELEIKRRPQFVAGDLKWQTTLVCLQCGMGKEVCGATDRQIARYCFDHQRTHKGEMLCEEIPFPAFAQAVRSWSGLKERETTPQNPCPVIWDAELVESWFSDTAKAAFVEKQVDACRNCLRVRKPKTACCKDMNIKEMRGKKVQNSHVTLLMNEPELQLRASLAQLEAQCRRNAVEQAMLLQSPVTSMPSTTPTTTRTSSPESLDVEARAVSFKNAMREGFMDSAVTPLSESKVIHVGEGNTVMQVDHSAKQRAKEVFQQILSAKEEEKRGAGTQKPTSSRDAVKEILLRDSALRIDEPHEWATFHEMDPRSNAEDAACDALGCMYYEKSYQLVTSTFDNTVLQYLSYAPQFAGYLTPDPGRDNQNRVSREWKMQPKTIRKRGHVLAKLIKVAIRLKIGAWPLLGSAVAEVRACFDTGRYQEVLPEELVTANALSNVHEYFCSLATSSSPDLLPSLLSPFAFVLDGRHMEEDEDGEEDDEAEDETSDSPCVPNSSTSNEPTRSYSTIGVGAAELLLKVCLSVLKLALGVCLATQKEETRANLQEYREQAESANANLRFMRDLDPSGFNPETAAKMASQFSSLNRAVVNVAKTTADSPLEFLLSRVRGKPALAQATTRLHAIQTIANDTPSLANLCTRTGFNAAGPILDINGAAIDGYRLRAGGKRMISDILDLLGHPLSTEGKERLKAGMLQPDSTFFTLETRDGGRVPSLAKVHVDEILQGAQFTSDISLLERARLAILSALHFGSGFTPRPEDLRVLDLHNLHALPSTTNIGGNVPGAFLISRIQKTMEGGVGLIPSFLLKALLFLQQCLVPGYLRVLCNELVDSIEDRATRDSLDREELFSALQNHVSRFPGLTLKKRRGATDEWRKAKGKIKVNRTVARQEGFWVQLICENETEDVVTDLAIGDALLVWLSTEQVRSALEDWEGAAWLQLGGRTRYGLLRALMVNVRAQSMQFIKGFLAEAGSEEQRRHAQHIEAATMQNVMFQLGLAANSSTGGHTLVTSMMNYSSAHAIGASSGGRNVRLSDQKLSAGLTVGMSMELILNLPSKRNGLVSGYRSVTASPTPELVPHARSIWTRVEQGLYARQGRSIEEVLREELWSKLKLTPLNPAQMQAMVAVSQVVNGQCVLVAADPGMGKTLTVLFPSSLSPGLVVYVVPYCALAISLEAKYTAMGFHCRRFTSATSREFDAQQWASSGPQPVSRAAEVVFCTTDSLMHDSFMQYLQGARLAGMLKLIVFDEAHQLLLASTYRVCMIAASRVTSLDVGVVMLSGTCPTSFETSLLGRFNFSIEDCTIIRSERDDGALARIINLVEIESPRLAVSALKALVRKSRARRTLVFCLTKKVADDIIDEIRSDEDLGSLFSRLDTLHADLEETERKRRVLQLQEPLPTRDRELFTSTVAAAEGPDVVCDEVVILGGTYLGPVSVVQMAGRIARGVCVDGQRFLCTVLYSRNHTIEAGFRNSPGELARASRETIELFSADVRGRISDVVTFNGLSSAVLEARRGTCGRIALYSSFRNLSVDSVKLGLPPCLACSSCKPDSWAYAEIFRSLEPSPDAIEPRVKRVASASNRGDSLPEREARKSASSAEALEREMSSAQATIRLVQDWLARFLHLDMSCLFCKQLHHPHDCPVIIETLRERRGSRVLQYLPKDVCRHCFSPSHRLADVIDAIEKAAKHQEDSSTVQLARECGYALSSKHELYANQRPCTTCWLSHPRERSCPCQRYHVRSCFLFVWYDAKRQKNFCDQMDAEQAFNGKGRPTTWRGFIEWGIFGGSLHLQNAYRVVAYAKGLSNQI